LTIAVLRQKSTDVSERNQHEAGGKQRLPATFYTLVSCLAYSSTLNMDATYFSETSVDFQQTIRRYIPEDRTIQKAINDHSVSLLGNHLSRDHYEVPREYIRENGQRRQTQIKRIVIMNEQFHYFGTVYGHSQ
jgi:hypothetical protein